MEYTGNVFWAPPTKFRSTCPVNVMYFPFDDQSCHFKLSSWMYDGSKVILVTSLYIYWLSPAPVEAPPSSGN